MKCERLALIVDAIIGIHVTFFGRGYSTGEAVLISVFMFFCVVSEWLGVPL